MKQPIPKPAQCRDLREATPVRKIVCRSTGAILGYEYRWDTGEIGVLWLDGEHDDVTYISLASI